MLSQEDIPVSSLWDLEMLGIRDTIEQNSREEKEKAVMSHFLETVRQKENGRYEVHMPWKVDRAFLTDNYELCLKRLESTTRKLEKIGFRENIMKSLENETGNNLIESVPAILARFRLKPIGVISDIRRAFLQISLHEKDRDFVISLSLSVPSFLYVSDSPLVSMEKEKREVPLRTADSQAGRCGMQPKPSSLRAQAQLSETKTETMRTETVETFELVKGEQKLLREEKGERERCASRRYLLHIIVKLIC
ncbi:CCHC-type domain-containing protein [Trichonephila clavipes]|nr:CCHC-type domain-containing protein [Trichonephila clavipes]